MEPVADLDDAYANAAHIPGAADFPPRWAAAAAAFRDAPGDRADIDIPYGEGARQRLDLFHPAGAARGLAVFVHGGYWRAFGKSDWSHLAAGPLAAGWAVAVPGYTLAPAARIARHGGGPHPRPGPAGRPFGGRAVGLPHGLPRHAAGPGRAGAHRPCADHLRRARSAAAAGHRAPGTRLTAWVGADERPEFRRQTGLIANVWRGLGAATQALHDPGRHHFDVIDGLAQPGSPLNLAFLGD